MKGLGFYFIFGDLGLVEKEGKKRREGRKNKRSSSNQSQIWISCSAQHEKPLYGF